MNGAREVRGKMEYLSVVGILAVFGVALYFLLLNFNQTAEPQWGVKGGRASSVPPRLPNERAEDEDREETGEP